MINYIANDEVFPTTVWIGGREISIVTRDGRTFLEVEAATNVLETMCETIDRAEIERLKKRIAWWQEAHATACEDLRRVNEDAGGLPLRCKVEGKQVVIRIGVETLAFAAENCPLFYDNEIRSEPPYVKVSDQWELAHDVCRAINAEAEDGSSALTSLLDDAIMEAFEDGSLGIDHEESPPLICPKCNGTGMPLVNDGNCCERCGGSGRRP